MRTVYTTHAQEDLESWKKNQPKLIQRIDKLIDDIKKLPFTGIGKPEPLKFKQSGYWSRRINQDHRLVYKIANNTIYIAQCRYHY